MGETGRYFYAITRDLPASVLAGVTGIGDAPVETVEHDGLTALVGRVDLADFGEDGLRRNLEDLAWLETVALAHDRVARTAAAHAPTAPLRLATVFLTDDAVRAQLAQWHDAASRALDRVAGCGEWSVKVYADALAPAAAEESPAAGTGAGRAYLLQRRAATHRKEEQARADAGAAENYHRVLAEAAVLGRRLAPQDKKLTGHTGEMVLNGTYLVEHTAADAFQETVADLAGRDARLRVEIGGPWPPYSFASLEDA